MRIEIEPLIKIITVASELLFAIVFKTVRLARFIKRKPKPLERRPDETSDQIQEIEHD